MSDNPTPGAKIFAEVKAYLAENNAKMASCPLPHRFTIPIDRMTKKEIPAPKMFCKWKCELCGAIQDFECKHWYELGIKHAQLRTETSPSDGAPIAAPATQT